jgi:hypothetical protein
VSWPGLSGFCDPLPGGADGAGIKVGSSIAVGCLTGVGVGVAAALTLGVGVPGGSNRRPRRCDTVGEAEAAGEGDISPQEQSGVSATTVENKKSLFMPLVRFKASPSVTVSVSASEPNRV